MFYRPIQWAKQSVTGRQDSNDGSRLVNFYAANPVAPEESKAQVVLYGAPGFSSFHDDIVAATDGAKINGLLHVDTPRHGDRLYVVGGGDRFYRLTRAGGSWTQDDLSADRAQKGVQINANNLDIEGPVRMATDGRRVAFAYGTEVYMWDEEKTGGAGFVTLRAPTATDEQAVLPSGKEWVDIAWTDGYFVLVNRSGDIYHSLLRSDQFDAADFARADSNPDGIVGLQVLNRQLYVFGERTIERWYNAGAADFAFRRDISYIHQYGAVSAGSIAANEEGVMFVGSDLSVHGVAGTSMVRFSTDAVDYDIARSDVSKCRAFAYTEEGHKFYSLTLEFAGGGRKNWTYDFTTAFWHERTADWILAHADVDGESVVGGDGSRSLHLQTLDSGVDAAGAAIERLAVSPLMFSDFNRLSMHEVLVDYRYETDNPQTDDASFRLRWSDDGKRTWKGMLPGASQDDPPAAPPRRIAGNPRLKWTRLGQFRRGRNFELQTAAAGRLQIQGAYAAVDMQPGT